MYEVFRWDDFQDRIEVVSAHETEEEAEKVARRLSEGTGNPHLVRRATLS